MNKISVIIGTRPEAIKLYPLILSLRKIRRFETHVCVTGQHRKMLDQILTPFGIIPDIDLDLMEHNQSLARFGSKALTAIDAYLKSYRPDLVLVQGDTTTVLFAALAAFYLMIPVGHVEAGLRTGIKYAPFPEEINRILTTRLVDLHFAPTSTSRRNLLRENVDARKIVVTGNTVIDALRLSLQKNRTRRPVISGLSDEILDARRKKRLILITGHRRENQGRGFDHICEAIRQLSKQFEDVEFVYPVHLNPRVRTVVYNQLSGIKNVHLIDPLDYFSFVELMNRSYLILTDSGGIQEEAPSLGKPVLVMRSTTERPEAIKAGTALLVGNDFRSIVNNVAKILSNPAIYEKMKTAKSPYGDGMACARIVAALKKYFQEAA